jgi:FKBP-type peptidyl-prolyl cis-trans isomerase
MLSEEIEALRAYVQRHHPSLIPNSDGVYTVVLEKGQGEVVSEGRVAVFDFTARLMDGTIWESSIEDTAYFAGIILAQRPYRPQELRIGENRWMLGLDRALIGHAVGSRLRLFLPSTAVFGRSTNSFIHNFQSVILDVDLLEIK